MAFFDKTPASGANGSLTGQFVHDVTQYLDTRLALARLDAQAGARNALVGALHGLTLALLALLALLFLSVFGALALNSALHSSYWGFGIVAGFYLVLTLSFVAGIDKGAFSKLAEQILHNKIYTSEIEQARQQQVAAEALASPSPVLPQ